LRLRITGRLPALSPAPKVTPVAPVCRREFREAASENCRFQPQRKDDRSYPGFQFENVKVLIDTPDQAFGETLGPARLGARHSGHSPKRSFAFRSRSAVLNGSCVVAPSILLIADCFSSLMVLSAQTPLGRFGRPEDIATLQCSSLRMSPDDSPVKSCIHWGRPLTISSK
jgi:hypothetical protein